MKLNITQIKQLKPKEETEESNNQNWMSENYKDAVLFIVNPNFYPQSSNQAIVLYLSWILIFYTRSSNQAQKGNC